jgi:hypothetical protein
MLASILIIICSLVLLTYWFRYSCLLLIRSHKVSPEPLPAASRFRLHEVQSGLKLGEALDPLHEALRRDYQLLMYLVEHASGLELESFEDRLLVLDYRIMRRWYGLMRALFPAQARRTLSEMASILAILVDRMGSQARA